MGILKQLLKYYNRVTFHWNKKKKKLLFLQKVLINVKYFAKSTGFNSRR